MYRLFEKNDDFASNMYLLKGSEGTILIDPSSISQHLLELCKSWGSIKAIIITHGHYDHFKALEAYLKIFPEAIVYLFKQERIFFNPHQNCSCLFNEPYFYDGDVTFIDEGTITMAGLKLEIIAFSGHSEGSMAIFNKEERELFVGDFIFKDSIGRCDLKSGSWPKMQESLKRFKMMNLDPRTLILPGHGPTTTYDYLMKNNPFLR